MIVILTLGISIAFILLVVKIIDVDDKDEKERYKKQKKELRAMYASKRYSSKLEKYKQKLERKLGNQSNQDEIYMIEPSRDEAYLNFLDFAHKQMEKFSSYSCKNDKALQMLLEKTFLSISRLTAKLDTDNYTYPEIFRFYNIELEHFFTLLGEGPTFNITQNSYEKLCSCLMSINNKATRLEESIKEWQDFTINVKFEALIEYIND